MYVEGTRHGGELKDEVFERLVREGTELFDRLTHDPDRHFSNLILADPRGARQSLRELRAGGRAFLELGSGIGVITIIADLLGYEAYGIEIEPRLVEASRLLAASVGSQATFIEGSFVPPEFQEDVDLLGADFETVTSGADAYEAMGMAMDDFDLVYAYPWPDEMEWLHSLFHRFAAPHATLLSYCVRDGFLLTPAESTGTRDGGASN